MNSYQLLEAQLQEFAAHYSDADSRQSPTYICRDCGYIGRVAQHNCTKTL